MCEQRQPGQLRIHRRLVAPQFRLHPFRHGFEDVGAGRDFQRHAIAQNGIADFGGNDLAHGAVRLVVRSLVKGHRQFPEAVLFKFFGERHLERVMKLLARHYFVRSQLESVNLFLRHLAHPRVIFRDGLGFRHARIINHDDLVAARRGPAAARRPAGTGSAAFQNNSCASLDHMTEARFNAICRTAPRAFPAADDCFFVPIPEIGAPVPDAPANLFLFAARAGKRHKNSRATAGRP